MSRNRILIAVAFIAGPQSGTLRAEEPSLAGRILQKEVIIDTTRDAIWQAWTTSEGIASFFSPDSKIGKIPGDPYEMYMGMAKPDDSGERGSEGCRLLSMIPREMISFEWNFPPKVPRLRMKHARTYVVLRFDEPAPGKVRVRFAQAGWQDGADWQKGWDYFDKAWSFVLNNLKKTLESKPAGSVDATPKTGSVAVEPRTWEEGHVTVRSYPGPEKRQEFEMTVPASAERLWSLLATSEGLKQLGGKDAAVQLEPFGAYAYWPGSNNQVLSWLPGEMLSTSGSAPPQFPNVRKGGTWSAYFFEPIDAGHTRVRLSLVGWKEGGEWDDAFNYFLKANPKFLNEVYLRAQ